MQRREWTAADLARRLDVPSGTISRWMSGERRPNPRSCDLIADVFGANVDDVLALAGHRPSNDADEPFDRRRNLHALVDRVTMTPDRLAALEGILIAWLEFDKEIHLPVLQTEWFRRQLWPTSDDQSTPPPGGR